MGGGMGGVGGDGRGGTHLRSKLATGRALASDRALTQATASTSSSLGQFNAISPGSCYNARHCEGGAL